MTPPFRFADIRGARLAWNQTGRGPAAVWAHGMSSCSYGPESSGQFDWRAVSSTHRLIRYDARGHGRSSGGRTADEYTWPELAADLLALLDIAAPGERVHAIGASMGTATILCAALAAPERFDRLVLTTAPTIWDSRRALTPLRVSDADAIERRGLAAYLRAAPNVPASPALVETERYVGRVAVRSSIYPWVLRGSAITDLPPADEFGALTQPTLILAWTGDPAHPVSSGELLAEALPNAELRVASTPDALRSWSDAVAGFLVTT
ncbi:alpha/beta fold hydrolase [Gordonia aquimaris]|uniref:Alpha/beta fold hydrolase n=1 Tax=Gordonia aquimaris TaxID=2984863 RepID=A0A9X3I3G3_9ACTN|nr:alpha/beta fold hydrolase [Gordonia aquimaris]MCX2963612.1 alpha/beta fold hydrolase [Gordonia aquimaris]